MADVDNRNRNRRSNRAGQPNPKREARAKAAERHVATVSKACAKDIERSLAGVREFDGMPAGFVAAMKAKVQTAVAAEEQVAEDVEGAEAAEAEAAPETEAAPEPVEEPVEEIAEAESAPAEEPVPVLPRSPCSMPPPRRPSWTTVVVMRSSATWPCSPLPRSPTRAVAIFRLSGPGGHAVRRFVSVQRSR